MMIRQAYDLEDLFEQLGLPSDQESIENFIQSHHLAAKVKLHEADFWSEAQRNFLESAFIEDEVWSLAMDRLNEELHD